MHTKIRSVNWHSIVLCTLIAGMFVSFVLDTFFVQTLLLWLLGGFAIYTGIRTRKFYFQWYSVFFVALFVLRIFAFFKQPELRFSDVEQSLSFLLFPLIFSLVRVDDRQWKTIQGMVVVGFSIFLLICLYRFFIHIYRPELLSGALASPKGYYSLFLKDPFYTHPSFLAVILCAGIPMCFNLAANAPKLWQQWLCLLFIPLLLFVVFASGSRVGLFVSIGLVGLCSLYFFKKLNSITTLALGLALGAVLVFAKTSTITYTEDPIRKEMNAFAKEKIKEQPFFGYGYSTQKAQTNKAQEQDPATFTIPYVVTMDHFHNTYLDEVFQFGFVGALPFYLLLLFLVVITIKNRNVFLLSFLAIYVLFFYTETPFNTLKGIMPMMLFLCVVMCVLNEKQLQKLQNSAP